MTLAGSNQVKIPIDDQRCPRVPNSMAGAPSRADASARFDEKTQRHLSGFLPDSGRRRILVEEQLIEVAGIVLRYERASKDAAKRERASTKDIANHAKHLADLLETAERDLPRAHNRIAIELTGEDENDRRAHGRAKYDELAVSLRSLASACRKAEGRIRIDPAGGRNDGENVQAVIHQLARMWLSWTGVEPAQFSPKQRASFAKLVRAVFIQIRFESKQSYHIGVVLRWRRIAPDTKHTRRTADSDN